MSADPAPRQACPVDANAARAEARRDRERTERVLEPKSIAARDRARNILARNHFLDIAQGILGGS